MDQTPIIRHQALREDRSAIKSRAELGMSQITGGRWRDTCVQLATFRFCHILGLDALCEPVVQCCQVLHTHGDGSKHGVLSRRTSRSGC